jgi:16S rRNA processing protein RimM
MYIRICTKPDMSEYFKIGKFVAAHGLQGELLLKHNLKKNTSLKKLQAIFTEDRKKTFLPWFIQSAKVKNETEIYIKVEGVHTREQALKLVQKETWLMEKDFKQFASKNSPANLLGYTIVNEGKPVGEISELIEQPHQLLCRLIVQGKEVLIPLHEESLQKINHQKKELVVKLPEGLLEIYLG